MKGLSKFVLGLIICILLVGIVFAANEGFGSQNNETGNSVNASVSNNASNSEEAQQRQTIRERNEFKDELRELRQEKKELKGNLREYLRERNEIRARILGKNVTFDKQGEKLRLRVENHMAETMLNITEELDEDNETVLKVKDSNGNLRIIKIMPDTVAERALERLRLKNCVEEEGCSIELKEVGQGEQAKLAYEMKTQRQSKVFGLFGARMQVQAQVDAETGEIVRVNKPWWAFLASEPAEE